ncbi:MAG TPA: HEAT repeat domain-containing protein, partial [Planctomycetota bacterium]|nr:HEAT repeat domain-containing protein [Planctomycetota bacterium]
MEEDRSLLESPRPGRGAARCLWVLALAPLALTPLLELPAAAGDPLAELARDLRHDRPETRRRAVRALAEVGSREAWMMLIGALEDGDSRVADEAELRLARLADTRLVAQLFGRLGLESRHETVRLRVAEAFGRFEVELEADIFARKISAREPELARMLLWSAERLASSGKLAGSRDALIAAARSIARSQCAPALRASALLALAALDPPGA